MPLLCLTGCESRRRRLLALLAAQKLDSAVITDPPDIYYFTGVLSASELPAVLVLDADENLLLVGPADTDAENCEWFVPYEWNHRGTRHPDASLRMLHVLSDVWHPPAPQRLGVQAMSLLDAVAHTLRIHSNGEFVALDRHLADMQRRKDADELALIRDSIRANFGAYAAVKAAIRPGVTELEVLSAGRSGAVREVGEKVFHDGDYQCGTYNGPARNRSIESGELYIVDAWTCYRGYWSDMSRTFIVGAFPTDIQAKLFEHIRWVQKGIEEFLRPGVDGTEVYQAMAEMIVEFAPLAKAGLIHHGGHGIGLRAHEMPDINLARGGKLEPGNVICLEPGGYFPAARAGVRLEDMYLITENGCENLCSSDVSLVCCG